MDSLAPTDGLRCFLLDHGFHQITRGPCCHTPHFPNVVGYQDLKRSPIYIEIQQSMARGQWHQFCHECRKIESVQHTSNHPSKRELWLPAYDRNLSSAQGLSVLTLDTGRLCNLSCRSCSPWLSTSWSKEWQQMHFVSPLDHFPAEIDTTWLEGQDFKDLVQIEVMGGEPIYNLQSVAPVIERAIADTDGQVSISMITNGTIFPDISRYPWFTDNKNISIIVSIDAIGAAAEFIRTGTTWTKIEDNIRRYQDIGVSLSYHVTHSVLNVLEVGKIGDWAASHGISSAGLLTVVDHPSYLTYSVLRPEEVSEIIDIVSDTQAQYLVPYLRDCKHDIKNREMFESFMAHTYSFHGQDWKKYLPDLAAIMIQ